MKKEIKNIQKKVEELLLKVECQEATIEEFRELIKRASISTEDFLDWTMAGACYSRRSKTHRFMTAIHQHGLYISKEYVQAYKNSVCKKVLDNNGIYNYYSKKEMEEISKMNLDDHPKPVTFTSQENYFLEELFGHNL